MDLSVVGNVRSLTTTQVEKLRITELKTALKTILSDTVEDKFTRILIELESVKQDKAKLQSNVDSLTEQVALLTQATMQQQKYLESIEAQTRRANLIITGVSEGDITEEGVTAKTDRDKCQLVFSKVGKNNVQYESAVRLGQPAQDKTRPIKVTLSDPETRKGILDAAKTLKDMDGYKRVFIRKDVHPLVQKEFRRLRDVEKAERDKPENQGRTVTYDIDSRTVKVDGKIVDQFKPQFF